MSEDIFTVRGISDEIKEARGYLPYEAGDAGRATILGPDGDPRLGKNMHFLNLATREPGWLMPKHSVMPWHPFYGEPALAQLRPDEPVEMDRPFGHNHAGMRHRRRGCRCGIREHDAAFMRSLGPYGWQYAMKRDERAAHERGKLHVDPDTGELLLPIDRPHVHTFPTKYLFSPGSGSKRLDANPLTLAAGWRGADAVVFCLEGSLKNDAIVTAGWPCFNVPSVSMWDIYNPTDRWYEAEDDKGRTLGEVEEWSNELEEFAAAELVGRPVIVVVDSDWSHNPQVLRHAYSAAARLRFTLGTPVIAAAPPEGELLPSGKRKKLGVDDWLGDSKEFGPPGDFLDLEARAITPRGLLELKSTLQRNGGIQTRTVDGMMKVVRALQLSATDDGHVALSPSSASSWTRIPERTVKRHNDRLMEARVMQEVEPARKVQTPAGVRTVPRVVQFAEPFRPEITRQTLRDWLAS